MCGSLKNIYCFSLFYSLESNNKCVPFTLFTSKEYPHIIYFDVYMLFIALIDVFNTPNVYTYYNYAVLISLLPVILTWILKNIFQKP